MPVRQLFAATLIAVIGTVSAQAADLAQRPYTKAPVDPEPVDPMPLDPLVDLLVHFTEDLFISAGTLGEIHKRILPHTESSQNRHHGLGGRHDSRVFMDALGRDGRSWDPRRDRQRCLCG